MTEPTGNRVVDLFLEELDIRCDGGRDTPADSAFRLRLMRPFIQDVCFEDADQAAVHIRELSERLGFDFGSS